MAALKRRKSNSVFSPGVGTFGLSAVAAVKSKTASILALATRRGHF